MKSTPLKRKTPLRRKKRVNPISKKRRALNALMNPGRTGFVLLAEKCMLCRENDACDCHEICRGAAREACLRHPRLWLALCRHCHELMDDAKEFPIERQIAIRIEWEIRRSVEEANEIRGRAQTALTDADVHQHLSP